MASTRLNRTLDHALLARDLRRCKAADQAVQDTARRHLVRRMGKMKGLPQKIGQALALNALEEPSDFRSLTEGGTALPLADLLPVLEARWDCRWQDRLAEIDPEGNAASLGQVHRARLLDGRTVAIKVAYPGIREAVRADLANLGLLTKVSSLMLGGVDFDKLRRALIRDLEEELDYAHEADQQREFAARLYPESGVVIPKVVDHLSNDRVLVTEWEQGATIDEAAGWPEAVRFQIGKSLVDHFLTFLFEHGRVHGDPHPGNYRFRRDPTRVILYDFGSVAHVEERRRLALLGLIRATIHRRGDPLPWMVATGFNEDLLEPMRDRLPAVCSVLFEPFLSPAKFDHRHWNRNQRLADILGEDRWNFRLAGPPELLFLVRGLQGLLYYLSRLNTAVSWQILLRPILALLGSKLDTYQLPLRRPGAGYESMARELRVALFRQGQQVVMLKFPAGAVERLEVLMGEELATRLMAEGWNLNEIKTRARASGLMPGDLLHHFDRESDREVKVWLV
ncbi:AarF/ABC1/UbiB kinase family protein [Sulfidibacter corallicola]|uniref:AarF/ABC1/UbiB kinase family protein n=1 Tax=Sulfidibacter corallicola TaxID=2818388 RepID=A0A8A4TBY9_SULCO|nr:AarF/ABC1/UbiB kinase family protein [Sulfidibacter corallicola]QTD47629.1 AarF/ABC1/UbiB kinase family protein [Sulfidibacter corallicola]